jgi:mannose-6-phosphate isomerase-like protein (cupin superfamily)
MDSSDTDAKRSLKGMHKKEAFHREAESRRIPFHYTRPDEDLKKRAIYFLGKTDILKAQVQIVPQGGENDLHYHPGADGFWWVITGRARFYDGDGIIGEYGPGEGILMPRNARYWFETADPSQELQLLQVSANTQQKVANKSIHVNGRNPADEPTRRFNDPPQAKPAKK